MGLLTMRVVKMAAVAAGLTLSALAAPSPAGSSMSGVALGAGEGASATAHSQGYLGVDIRDVRDGQLSALKLKEARGAEVIRVDHDGPAGKAGLREQDVILQMNGIVIENEEQLRRMLRETPAGRTVTLLFSRAGQMLTVTTHLANRMDVERQAWEERWVVPVPEGDRVAGAAPAPAGSGNGQGSSGSLNSVAGKGQGFLSPAAREGHDLIGVLTPHATYTGAILETIGPQLAEFFGTMEGGLLVSRVDANSPADAAGLKAGDIVLRANSLKMATSSEWSKVIRENRGKTVEVVVLRDKKEQTLKMIPDSKKRSSIARPHGGRQAEPVMANLLFPYRRRSAA